jgi:hypothetical protein
MKFRVFFAMLLSISFFGCSKKPFQGTESTSMPQKNILLNERFICPNGEKFQIKTDTTGVCENWNRKASLNVACSSGNLFVHYKMNEAPKTRGASCI